MTMTASHPATPLAAPVRRPALRRAAAADFDAFYQAHYAGTVAVAFGLTGDRGDAQDLAQEAYCRAWQRWTEISRYDNPPAWVYRVTVNLARSRWRNLRVAAAHLVRQRVAEVPPVDPEHVALVTALRALPMDQREAIVLHHLVDLPVSEVAQEMGVPAGTVKSWLHRGRGELAGMLTEHSGGAAPIPSAEVRARAARQRRLRHGVLTTATAAACVLAVFLVLQLVRPGGLGPVPPAQSPTPGVPLPSAPAPSPVPVTPVAADDPIRAVDWLHATITVPAEPGCPAGRLTLRTPPGSDSPSNAVANEPGQAFPQLAYSHLWTTYGDLTGDGRAEAVLRVTCSPLEVSGTDGVARLLVVSRGADGSLRGLGWLGQPDAVLLGFWIAGDVVYAETRPEMSAGTTHRTGQALGFRWHDGRFTQVDTSAAYPPVVPTMSGRRLDLTPVADRLACGGQAPPAGDLRPVFGADGTASADGRFWRLLTDGQRFFGTNLAVLDPARPPYLLLAVSCRPAGAPSAQAQTQLVAFETAPDGWRAVGHVFASQGGELQSWGFLNGVLTVTSGPSGGAPDGYAAYRWNGSAFDAVTEPVPTP